MANDRNLSTGLTVGSAAHRIFGAIRDRINVLGSASDGVAGRSRKRRANQGDGQDLLEHGVLHSSLVGEQRCSLQPAPSDLEGGFMR